METSGRQIVENLTEHRVQLHGVTHRLSDLCSGALITGATGSGKTTSIVNPLAAAIARLNPEDPDQRAAVLYLNSKGDGARDFLARLPSSRRADIVYIGESSSANLVFFDREYWTDSTQLAEATMAFLLEASRFAIGTPDREGNHKTYFEGLRDRPLRLLSHLVLSAGSGGTAVGDWFEPRSHLVALVRRIREFIALVEQGETGGASGRLSSAARLLKEVAGAHQMSLEDFDAFVSAAAQAVRSGSHKERAVLQLARRVIDDAIKPAEAGEATGDGLRGLLTALPPRAASQLTRLAESSRRIHQESRYSLCSELASLCELFDTGPIARLSMPGAPSHRVVSFEDVIDRGKIVVVDLPVADSAGSSRMALALVALHFQQVALRRRVASRAGRGINTQRPVLFVADEFPAYLCSRGRHDGLEHWLSRSREFGVIPLLATQTLGLLTEALGSANRTRSLLANVRTQFMAGGSCSENNQWASWMCGRRTRSASSSVINWWNDPAIERILSRQSFEDAPLVRADEFSRLETGEYILHQADGRVLRVNASYRLTEPTIEVLSGGMSQIRPTPLPL